MKRIIIKKYQWEVTDNFGDTTTFDDKRLAEDYQKIIRQERRVINYIRPKGVTLVVSKDNNVFYRAIPAFLGYDGVPYAEAPKDKDREHFMDLMDPINYYGSISGDIITMLREAYRRISQSYETRLWNKKYGNKACCSILHPVNWTRGALWYNWDGEKFTTNDKKCKITTEDFLK
ncbi:MAG: hypothetical protein IKO36_09235 [Bacteroidaceae bacterium]|nr:hypothetical protein [Bacteroidaceae bacterium]